MNLAYASWKGTRFLTQAAQICRTRVEKHIVGHRMSLTPSLSQIVVNQQVTGTWVVCQATFLKFQVNSQKMLSFAGNCSACLGGPKRPWHGQQRGSIPMKCLDNGQVCCLPFVNVVNFDGLTRLSIFSSSIARPHTFGGVLRFGRPGSFSAGMSRSNQADGWGEDHQV